MALYKELEKQGNWLFRHRGTLPLIIILAGLLVYAKAMYYREYFFLHEFDYFDLYLYLCLGVSLFGFIVRIYTVGHTPKNTSGRNIKGQLADTLNTTGIYSIVRHPLYVGNFFMWLGPTMFAGNLWFAIAVCFFFWIYYERIMYAEESFLMNKFGDTYSDWANNVPAFIPDFRLFYKPVLPFSWKKVIKKEKNGITAIFIIFCVFDIIGKLITEDDNYDYVIIIAAAFFIFVYFVIKLISKFTRVFEEEGR